MQKLSEEVISFSEKSNFPNAIRTLKSKPLIHSLWLLSFLPNFPMKISLSYSVWEINQLVESLNELKIPSNNDLNNFEFIRDIIHIVKVIGNEMNKGYASRQDMDKFSLKSILSDLFKMSSVDSPEAISLFDVVLSTYLKYKGVKLSEHIIKKLILSCK